jgi:hypothetical protein
MNFKAKLFRMCRLRIRGKILNYSIIRVHDPTEDKNEEENMLYDELHKTYDECRGRDVNKL